MRKNSVKNSRINGEVQRVLAEVIRGEIKDPRIAPMTSVVDVEVAPDLKTCRAYISVLGSEEEAAATLEGLKSAEGFIRGRLAKEINLRNTPEIHFIMDQSIAYGVNMSHKIDMVMADQRAKKERKRMRKILEELGSRDTIAIGGHVRPDGDCVGSCMGMYLYLKKRCRMHRLMCIWKSLQIFLTAFMESKMSVQTAARIASMTFSSFWIPQRNGSGMRKSISGPRKDDQCGSSYQQCVRLWRR